MGNIQGIPIQVASSGIPIEVASSGIPIQAASSGISLVATSCPADFNERTPTTCAMKCPMDFKYVQSSGGLSNQCVHAKFNDKAVDLNELPKYDTNTAEPQSYASERQRVNAALNTVRTDVQALDAAQGQLETAKAGNIPFDGTFKGAQAQFTGYTAMGDMAKKLKETTDAMKPPRQPTAPRKDIAEERRRVLSLSESRIKLVQVALLTVLVIMVVYLVLPFNWAHGVAFLVACVGIAIGIFLTST